MDKKAFIEFLNEVFKQFGFKKKGNNWFSETNDLKKVINLQHSNFGNYYYINYGWIIKNLELPGNSHIGGRLASLNKQENIRIDELLNLEKDIRQEDRKSELYAFIKSYLVQKLQEINTEEELSNYLKNLRPPLSNMIPGVVRNYFNIPL